MCGNNSVERIIQKKLIMHQKLTILWPWHNVYFESILFLLKFLLQDFISAYYNVDIYIFIV